MLLTELKQGESAVIVRIRGKGAFRRRVAEMGFVAGERVHVVRKAPLNDPVEYSLKSYNIILRNHDARLIEIAPASDKDNTRDGIYDVFYTYSNGSEGKNPGKTIHIALLGNPTSGKTTLFNRISGLNEKVGNYSGVTLDAKTAEINFRSYKLVITDLPGIYSLRSESHGNKINRDFLFEYTPDVIINVVDATNLERNLYLTTDIIDLDIKTVMALNMYDLFEKTGSRFDEKFFGKMTGIPVVTVSSTRGDGIENLLTWVTDVFENKEKTSRHVHINYQEDIERSVKSIQDKINKPGNVVFNNMISSRFLAIKLLEKDTVAPGRIREHCANAKEIITTAEKEINRIEKLYHTHSESNITGAKYGFINGALKETLQPTMTDVKKSDDVIDAVLTHRIFGLPIFLGLMWLMFAATFKLGSYPMNWIEHGVTFLSAWTENVMSPGVLRDLIVDGLISGMGGVLVFLPNILLLYFFIALMEDTGYMSRAVFIMDRIMHRMGLHGKSFIPLVMGFGCNVPAILATRMLENRKDRMVTILINPFMSCNARLPVYILFIGAFFPAWQGLVFFGIYSLGIIVAIVTAILLKKTVFKSDDHPFVMELPPYRAPAAKAIVKQMWDRTRQYLKKIGGVILIASVIFWALSYFPRNVHFSKDFNAELRNAEDAYNMKLKELQPDDTVTARLLQAEHRKALETLAVEQSAEQIEQSFIGRIGRFIEPVISPLGFDWRIGVSLISGIPAKEIIISTMSVLYRVDGDTDTHHASLRDKINAQLHTAGPLKGDKVFNPAVALALMVFVLLYIPCIGTLIAVSRETGSWKWGAFSLLYSLSLAWIFAFIVYKIGMIFF